MNVGCRPEVAFFSCKQVYDVVVGFAAAPGRCCWSEWPRFFDKNRLSIWRQNVDQRIDDSQRILNALFQTEGRLLEFMEPRLPTLNLLDRLFDGGFIRP